MARSSTADPRGAIWRRWDPHIHTPGTLFEDRYRGDDPWEDFLAAVEAADPPIQALGVTDYWLLDNYRKVREYWDEGRLPGVQLVFPNIEMRLATATKHGAAINVHLLISPDDGDHVDQAQRVLNKLTFDALGETYHCHADDLVRLGERSDSSISDREAALRHGAKQFKVTHAQVRSVLEASAWAKENMLVAFAASSKDGTAGLQDDSSFREVRREIERMSHIVFTSSPKERRYWLGEGADSVAELQRAHGGRKACLHGSDAHCVEKVGAPDQERRTWLKGDPTFETLRQSWISPDLRAVVAQGPPTGPLPNKTVAALEVHNAQWWTSGRLLLNPGLVAVIGPRGSGKTALADFIAVGGNADVVTEIPFIGRAGRLLAQAEVAVDWGDGATVARSPLDPDQTAPSRIQYLSQQFVERLCGADGDVSEELREEIERVIFEAHPPEERSGATTFDELRDIETRELRARREHRISSVEATGDRIVAERRKQEAARDLEVALHQQEAQLKEAETNRARFVVGNAKTKVERLATIRDAVAERQTQVDALEMRGKAVRALQAAVSDLQETGFSRITSDLQSKYADAGLSADDWEAFRLKFEGEVGAVLEAAHAKTTAHIQAARGTSVAAKPGEPAAIVPYVSDEADLSKVPLAALRLEAKRLEHVIGLDERRAQQLQQLDDGITKLRRSIQALKHRLNDAKGAPKRVDALFAERLSDYAEVFETFADEAERLRALYLPLREGLGNDGAMAGLEFTVRRRVDVDRWVAMGESLLDLRRGGPFTGRGALRRAVEDVLAPAWRSGSGQEVRAAMGVFRENYVEKLRDHAKVTREDNPEAYWDWSTKVSRWLTGTDHITVDYAIEYDGVGVQQLSPGTRGIVLLLLYVAIDRSDDRPLIIDQPEENLDPKSIYEELVQRFSEVRHRRQVIIVTHNANLVVNTDVDQVIVADAEPRSAGELPRFRYTSGGLEDQGVREAVCGILEGGAEAFRERARRLRVGPAPGDA
ncbi:MAG TPA: AAA family ATPase [Thermoleophilaceae bacterium]|nr:AAA family ATPase [Thermoleophilaceae bacterium]